MCVSKPPPSKPKSCIALSVIVTLATVSLLYALSRPWGNVPALGQILNPFMGLWRQGLVAYPQKTDQEIFLPNLEAEVQVDWDEYGVPHLHAENLEDAYRVQGYLHASQRLFQMDMLTRAGQARLSEIAGAKTRKIDEFFIRFGLREVTARVWDEAYVNNDLTRKALQAYSQGVNDYILSLDPFSMPVEYQLLSLTPEPWTPERTSGLLKSMSFSLAGRSFDLLLTEYAKRFGKEKIRGVFPWVFPDAMEAPFIKKHKPRESQVSSPITAFESSLRTFPAIYQPFISNGSNNWAVSPKKSQTGFSILANDTHLGLTLPPIWYEQQIRVGEMNVYGAGFPGAPGVLLGFTPEIAWAVTNGTTDSLDWYEVEFRDKDSLEYLWDSHWLVAEHRKEPLYIRGEPAEVIDVIRTKAGYVIHREGKLGLAARWTGHEVGNELLSFLRLNRAKSLGECREALETFKTPVQNFICADQKQVGIYHVGALVDRREGEGQFVQNGRVSSAAWRGLIASDDIPFEQDPDEGFVFSANQRPVPKDYPRFLGWDYENSYRGQRIGELLKVEQKFSGQDFIKIQSDSLDPMARSVLPAMLFVLDLEGLSSDEHRFASLLERWDFRADGESIAAGFFYAWWYELKRKIWSDQLGEGKDRLWPRDRRVELMLLEAQKTGESSPEDRQWIDDARTEAKESIKDIVTEAYRQTWMKFISEFGGDQNSWRYETVRSVRFPHLAKIPGWGRNISSSGTRHSLFAVQEHHGPTWNLVVELGPQPRAWSRIPGSNEGHPFRKEFGSTLSQWAKGESKEVYFLRDHGPKDWVRWRFKRGKM